MGYQCSNYYRHLIREGVIIDDNYYVDENNQLVFRLRQKKERRARPKRRDSFDGEEMMVETETLFDGMNEDENCLPVGKRER